MTEKALGGKQETGGMEKEDECAGGGMDRKRRMGGGMEGGMRQMGRAWPELGGSGEVGITG